MSGDWKKDLERKLAAEKAAAEKAEAERQAEAEAVELEIHKTCFFCVICGKESRGPTSVSYSDGDWTYDGYARRTIYKSYTDWDKPTGLEQCSKCQRWACDTHIYLGICQSCAKSI